MEMIYEKKTYISEREVWISTVAYDRDIGMDRSAETMVFNGNEEEITDFGELDFDHLGYTTDEKSLDEAHKRMVEKWTKSESQEE